MARSSRPRWKYIEKNDVSISFARAWIGLSFVENRLKLYRRSSIRVFSILFLMRLIALLLAGKKEYMRSLSQTSDHLSLCIVVNLEHLANDSFFCTIAILNRALLFQVLCKKKEAPKRSRKVFFYCLYRIIIIIYCIELYAIIFLER